LTNPASQRSGPPARLPDVEAELASYPVSRHYAVPQGIALSPDGGLAIAGPQPGRSTPLPGYLPGHEAFWGAW